MRPACREVYEELGVTVAQEDLALLGSWTGSAANELDTLVDATVHLSLDPPVELRL